MAIKKTSNRLLLIFIELTTHLPMKISYYTEHLSIIPLGIMHWKYGADKGK